MTAARLDLLTAVLLTFAGGSMDACTYVAHGHVFATAQTGNIVLLALGLASGDFADAGRHVPSLLAFSAAIVCSRILEGVLDRSRERSPALRLFLECVGLLALVWYADRLPDMVVTASVAFIGGLQLTTFSRVDSWSFNSTITTGNLRDLFSAISMVWLRPGEGQHRRRAIALGAICLAFFAGALVGGYCTMRLGDRALLLTTCSVLTAAFLLRARAGSNTRAPGSDGQGGSACYSGRCNRARSPPCGDVSSVRSPP